MLKAEIDRVKRGKDPVGVVGDAAKNRLIAFHTITDSKREVRRSRQRTMKTLLYTTVANPSFPRKRESRLLILDSGSRLTWPE